MKQLILTLISLLLLTACSSKQLYTFGDTSSIAQTVKNNHDFIAVEKVELPIYFMDSPIYKKSTPFHLTKIDQANWINAMDEHLSNVLISYLQKSMNNPNIYAYPWSTIKRLDKKISLTITEFIAYQNMVTLEANYRIFDKKNNQTSNYFFQTKEPIKEENIESMLRAMEESYFRLAQQIKSKL